MFARQAFLLFFAMCALSFYTWDFVDDIIEEPLSLCR